MSGDKNSGGSHRGVSRVIYLFFVENERCKVRNESAPPTQWWDSHRHHNHHTCTQSAICCFHIAGRSVVSVLYGLFSDIAPFVLSVLWLHPATPECVHSSSTGNAFLVKLTKYRLWLHTSTLIPDFCGWNYLPRLFCIIVPNRTSSKQCTTISYHLPFWPLIFINRINPS